METPVIPHVRRERRRYYDELLPEEQIDPAHLRNVRLVRGDSDSESSYGEHAQVRIGVDADVHACQSPEHQGARSPQEEIALAGPSYQSPAHQSAETAV